MSMISAAAKRLRLALATVAGAGMVGFDLAQGYAAGTLGAFVKAIMAGPTFTGPVTLPGDAAGNLHAVPRQQLTSSIAAAVSAAVASILDGFTATGPIVLPGDAVGDNDAVRLRQVLDLLEVVAGEIILEKPGDLILTASPTMAPGTKRVLVQGQAIALADHPTLGFLWCGAGLNDAAGSDFFYRCTDPANPHTTRNNAGDYLKLPPAGYFLRALNTTGAGVDAGRSPFKLQADMLASHNHETPAGPSEQDNASTFTNGNNPAFNVPTTYTGGDETRPKNWGAYVWLAW